MALNGQLNPAELTQVDGWALLTGPTARAYVAAKRYIEAHFNASIIISSPDGAYRSLARQIVVKALFGRLASVPGYSNHGLGIALDINNIGTMTNVVGGQAALDAIMARYGFVRNAGNGAGGIEQWHYTLAVVVNLAGLEGAQLLHDPIEPPETPEDEDMKLIQHKDRGIAVVGPGYFKGLTGEELSLAIQLYGNPTVFGDGPVGARQFDLVKSISTNGLSSPAAPIDQSALSNAIAAQVVAALPAGADAAIVASAVDAALTDNFGAIPAAVRAAIIK